MLLSFPVAAPASTTDQNICAGAVAGPGAIQKTKIDGLDDTEFIARTIYELDDFWAKQTAQMTPEMLGLTPASITGLIGTARAAKFPVQFTQNYRNVKVTLFDREIDIQGVTVKSREMPFYYPVDQTIYISNHALRTRVMGFLKRDVEWAFILAHETAHHVQLQMGLLPLMNVLSGNDEISRRIELQADCLAGYWIGHNRDLFGMLEVYRPGKIAGRVGSDGHGSNAQRRRWYKKGFRATSVSQCDSLSLAADQL